MAVESHRKSSHSNFLFSVLSKSPNQMRDRLPIRGNFFIHLLPAYTGCPRKKAILIGAGSKNFMLNQSRILFKVILNSIVNFEINTLFVGIGALRVGILLKAHCHGADWINKTIKKKRIRQGSVISMYSEIHGDDNDLISFILETKYNPRTKRLGNYSKASALFFISTSQLANRNHDSVPLTFKGNLSHS